MLSSVSLNTNHDDITLISLAKAGETQALSSLISRYSDMVLQKSRSFKNISGLESDDIYQEGMLGLLSAIYSFDESRGVLFSTYASVLVTRKMLSALRSTSSRGNLPLKEYTPIENETELLSAYPDPEELLLYNEELDFVNSFIENNLSKTEKKVLKLRFLGLSYSEIAEILDCGEKSVDNALQRIRRKYNQVK
ncbi:MAG: sigma-70 family RNA polymerase sigma factor [Oscillospiraceae bacterium]|nr:sigma-70 family RNA polymerase sigma factor [Oscillospiraceae bacterium]